MVKSLFVLHAAIYDEVKQITNNVGVAVFLVCSFVCVCVRVINNEKCFRSDEFVYVVEPIGATFVTRQIAQHPALLHLFVLWILIYRAYPHSVLP